MKQIAIIGEFNSNSETHAATNLGLSHSLNATGLELGIEWIETSSVNEAILSQYEGIFLAPGGYADDQKAELAIKFGRERNIPTLGTCGGFQSIILELARNVLGFQDAAHEEHGATGSLFISRLQCSLRGRWMTIALNKASKIHALYAVDTVEERYYCHFGVNPEYVPAIEKSGVMISGSDDEGVIRIIELPEHRFFVGTLFVPQANSTETKPHPLINGFVEAIAR